MTKKILILYSTQSGQMADILVNYSQAFSEKGHEVELVEIKPLKKFPFPWTSEQFFSVMPDCVLGKTVPLEDFTFKHTQYDLIVLGYQPWFLSPSLPVNSLLNHPQITALLKDTPVITVCGARNMWINALEKIKQNLHTAGARLVGNIVLVDKHANLISVVTILYWMLSGKKDSYLGLFPKPGVADEDIRGCKKFGELSEKYLSAEKFDGLQAELIANKAVIVNYNLLFTESKAGRIFKIWANFIDKRQNKKPWLIVFKYYLIIAIFIVAPILIIMNTIFIKPFIQTKIKKQINYYSGVNL